MLHGRRVDMGASYLTARDPAFQAVVDDWVARGLAHPWTDRFAVAGADGWTTTHSPLLRYGTPRGMRTLVEDLAAPLDVRTGVDATLVIPGPCVDGLRWDAVVLALPDEQALDLLDDALSEERAAVARPAWEPVLSLAPASTAARGTSTASSSSPTTRWAARSPGWPTTDGGAVTAQRCWSRTRRRRPRPPCSTTPRRGCR
jgi:predicted NAD/FAD-dependent oxidoreductase